MIAIVAMFCRQLFRRKATDAAAAAATAARSSFATPAYATPQLGGDGVVHEARGGISNPAYDDRSRFEGSGGSGGVSGYAAVPTVNVAKHAELLDANRTPIL